MTRPHTSARNPTTRSAGSLARRKARAPRREDAEVGRLRRRATAGRLFVPSALTILAICAGLTAIRVADENANFSMALVVAAAILDGIDGRVARMMGATTRIGAEIDSLADAINFGVVPGLLVYLVLLDDTDIGWIMTLVYVCAIVLRLARFNTLLDDEDAPGYTRDFFVGVPAPAAALIALLPIGVAQQFGADGWWTSDVAVCIWMVLAALLAVSRVPTASFKTTSVPPGALAALLIVVAIAAALLLTYPYVLMIIAIAAYLIHIPFAWRSQRWVAARPEHWDARPAERRAIRAQGSRRRPALGRSQARLGLRRPGGEVPTNPPQAHPPQVNPAPAEPPAADPEATGA